MPADFPSASYSAVNVGLAGPRLPPPLRGYFGGAWNAISYRFRAAADLSDEWVELIARHGVAPPHEVRYGQERTVFAFFANIVSVFDAASFGMFAIGAALSPAEFPLASDAHRRGVSPKAALDAYTRAFPGDPILAAMDAVRTDAAMAELLRVRNIITHRVVPGRVFSVNLTIGGAHDGEEDATAAGAEWREIGLQIDADMTVRFRAHAARLLSDLLGGLQVFTTARFP